MEDNRNDLERMQVPLALAAGMNEKSLLTTTTRFLVSTIDIEKLPYTCPGCGETHPYKKEKLSFGGRISYSRDACSCEVESAKQAALVAQVIKAQSESGICGKAAGKLAEFTFETTIIRPGLEKALERSKEFAREYPCPTGLIICGTWGCGKTRLACSIGHELIERGHRVLFIRSDAFLKSLRACYENKEASESAIITKVQTAPLLILDDLGNDDVSDSSRPWANGRLLSVIDYRDNHKLPMVVTTNYSPKELINIIGGASVSRLLGMCDLVQAQATDFRLEQAKSRKGRGE